MADPIERHLSIFHLHAEFGDFDALAEAIEGWDLDWQQLDRGRLEATLQQIRTPSALLSRVGFSRQFHQRGGTPPDFVTIGILEEGAAEVNWCGQVATSQHLLAFPTGGEYESMSRPGFGAHTLSFSKDQLDRIAQSLGHPEATNLSLGSGQVLACAPAALAELRRELRSVFLGVAADSSILSTADFRSRINVEIPSLLLQAIGRGGEPEHKLSFRVRTRVARSAVDMIVRSSDEPLTVHEICASLGVSQRTLQYAFREQFDVTPKQYLQAVRLNGVRRDLRRSRPTTTVADTANHWGFWHMGQFARDYRRHFGELPSQTLSRP